MLGGGLPRAGSPTPFSPPYPTPLCNLAVPDLYPFFISFFIYLNQISHLGITTFEEQSVQSLSCVRLSAILWTAAHQDSLSITNSRGLLKLMSIESVMLTNHLILCHPLLFPPSILSNIRVFSNESLLHIRWPKYWTLSFSISRSNEYSGLISFRIDWLDLPAVQGTLKTVLQHHSSKSYFSLFQIYLSDSCVSSYHSQL